MTDDPKIRPPVRPSPEIVYDQRKAMVKEMMDKESASLDAKTMRLKALRLARDAEAPPRPSLAKTTRKRAT